MTSQSPTTTSRLWILRIITVIIFAILIGQLARLQFLQGLGFQKEAVVNRIRVVREKAPRGVIYDRDGRILARNTAAYAITIIPAALPDDPDYEISQKKRLALYQDIYDIISEKLAGNAASAPEPAPTPDPKETRLVLDASQPPEPTLLTVEEMDKLVSDRELGSSFQPVIVAENLPREVALQVQEEAYRLPGVQMQLMRRREYPSGFYTSHIIGYMGPIPQEKEKAYAEKGYAPDAWVGWSDIEYQYEEELHGQPGVRVIEVDVKGQEKNEVRKPTDPEPGHNLILSLDLELQKIMSDALVAGVNPKRSSSAAAIAVDPRTGYVLGMVSLPTYDNNIFADGITPEEYKTISEAPGFPLLDHAISGIYPPGSTFKLVTAAAGLEEKVITRKTILNAPGIIYLPNRNFPDDPNLAQPFVCWIHKLGGEHGDINITAAIAESCDIFFYKVGGGYPPAEFDGLGVQTLADYARLFGYGERSGIDLPGENAGLIPDPKWKRIAKGERWVTGDTYNMAIGQGDVLATPLQVTMMTAAVANDGILYQPQVVAAVTDAKSHLVTFNHPIVRREIPVKSKNLDIVREGMWMVVNWEFGTAKNVALPDVEVAGKTGTAEFFDPELGRDLAGNLPSHAWFTAYAPYDDPEIAITVFVYNGGEGSQVAAPIAREILRGYFDIKARDEAAGNKSLLDRLEEIAP
jgi:penicillin-binding protein 2